MTLKDYKSLAMRTNDGKCTDRLSKVCLAAGKDEGGIINACLGLSGEVGELNDMMKKAIFHGHEIDEKEVMKEIGDIMWYVALMCDSCGFDLEEIAKDRTVWVCSQKEE